MVGPYPYYGPTGQLDSIADYRLDGTFALIGEDGDHFLDVVRKPQTILVSGRLNVNNHAHVIESTRLCCAEWFYNYFLHRSLKPHLTRQGAGRYKLNKAALRALEIVLPPLHEQVAINRLLLDWDAAIEKTGKLVALKSIAYTRLVRRLIVVPSDRSSWQRVSLREIAGRIQRQTDGAVYPLLTISSSSGFVLQSEKYSRYMAGKSAESYTLLRRGEFAYNKGNSKRYEFGCIFQLQSYDAALVPSVYVSFRVREPVSAGYMRHLFTADYLKPQLRALVRTGVRNNGLLNIRPDDFMSVKVSLPSSVEQQRICSVLDAAIAEIEILKQQLNALREQKRGLMQKLLPGEWRLPTTAAAQAAETP